MQEHEVAVAKTDVGVLAFLESADVELQLALELVFELGDFAFSVLEFLILNNLRTSLLGVSSFSMSLERQELIISFWFSKVEALAKGRTMKRLNVKSWWPLNNNLCNDEPCLRQ